HGSSDRKSKAGTTMTSCSQPRTRSKRYSADSITMPDQPRKMSDIMKEMSETLLRNPSNVPSSEAAHVALLFANAAWNECVGMDHARDGYRNAWETIESENPSLWNEFKSNNIDAMIDELVQS